MNKVLCFKILAKGFLLILSFSALTSCQHQEVEFPDRIPEAVGSEVQKLTWSEFLELKTSAWEISYGGGRTNRCQLGDGEPFDCSGGTCFLRRDVAGHDACVGCTVNDTMACTGSPFGGVIIIVLSEMAVDYPDVNIEYTLYDENDVVLDVIEGEIGTKMVEINNANQQSSASKFDVKLSSN